MSKVFICDNVYTILVAVIMTEQMFSYDEVDIIVTDRTPGAQDRETRIKEIGMFRNVYYIDSNSCYNDSPTWQLHLRQCRCLLLGCNRANFDMLNFDYSDIYTLHINCLANAIAMKLQKQDKKVNLHFIEEGYGSYTNFFRNMEFEFNHISGKIFEKFAMRLNRCKHARELLVDINVFEPKMLMWNPPFPIKKINKPNFEKNPDLRTKINHIFNYEESCEIYLHKKVIYFEDCYYQDKGDNSDLKIIDKIANTVDNNEFIIKLHPRTKTNRFCEKYDTNKEQDVPWEVISMNMPYDKSYALVTLSSGSVIGCSLMFSIKLKCIMLYKCLPNRKLYNNSSYLQDFLEEYAKKYPEYLSIPKTVDEALIEIKKCI